MKTLKMYAGKKYSHLNIKSEGTLFNVIKVIGNHVLMLSIDRNGYKRLINHTANNGGSIIVTSYTLNKHGKEPILCCEWRCDFWAMPSQAMKEWLDYNKFELLELTER